MNIQFLTRSVTTAYYSFPNYIRQRTGKCFCTAHNVLSDSIVPYLSKQDLIGLLSRLSPLTLAAHSKYTELVDLQIRTALSSKDVLALRQVEPIAISASRLKLLRDELMETASLMHDPGSDDDLKTLAEEEHDVVSERLFSEAKVLLHALINSQNSEPFSYDRSLCDEIADDPHSGSRALIEVRAGTGGDEAALFASELVDMYVALATYCGWSSRVLSRSRTELGGTRESIIHMSGDGVLQTLSVEAGVHRVQRVPQTETQGRVHTSTASVAILRDTRASKVNLNRSDLRYDVYRASGAGGQHVNTTESAVRITHIPTGVIATCQDERSQHRNRAVALETLTARIAAKMAADAHSKRAGERRDQLGSTAGERSDKIRTYNFPQRRVTDHRVVINSSITSIAPSVKNAIGDKNAPLQFILGGGKHLLDLMKSVRTVQTLNGLTHLLKRADREKCPESEEFSQTLIPGDSIAYLNRG